MSDNETETQNDSQTETETEAEAETQPAQPAEPVKPFYNCTVCSAPVWMDYAYGRDKGNKCFMCGSALVTRLMPQVHGRRSCRMSIDQDLRVRRRAVVFTVGVCEDSVSMHIRGTCP